ncbi:MAG TPA: HAD family hydrolase [Candidatus Ozemobacteraceae bacterium]|nr:HAD family hydrolase [Candidatus Ozemobacteraceae bacterium]HQG28767.1 HAD family hydrolase [Candidatus Ozemobacteraceae bacterium]
MMRRAVFLDRDGTLNPDPGYISRPEDFELFPETPKTLRRLRDAGFLLIIVTNQSGVARGIIPPASLERIHEKMRRELERAGAAPDAIYVCPHHPDFPQPGHAAGTACGCRKPEPGLVIRAIADWKIDAASSFVVGDRMTDVQMGLAAGVPPVLVGPKKPSDLPPHVPCLPDLPAAVDWILSQG